MKFAIGDHVRVIARTDRYFDHVGVVSDIDTRTTSYPFRVEGLYGANLWYAADELILAEPDTQNDGASESGGAEGVEVPGVETEALSKRIPGREHWKFIGRESIFGGDFHIWELVAGPQDRYYDIGARWAAEVSDS